MKSTTYKVKTAVAPFWSTFGRFWIFFIPTSGHTDDDDDDDDDNSFFRDGGEK